jgi:hypothetical protein
VKAAKATLAALGASALLVFAAGCGDKTDVSAGVADFNKQLATDGLMLDCPKEIEGGEGTTFDCTLKGKNGKSAPVKLKVTKENGDLVVDVADQAAFDQVRQEVAGG